MPVFQNLLVVGQHEVLVDLTTTGDALRYLTSEVLQGVIIVGGILEQCGHVGRTIVVVTRVGIQTEAVGGREVFQECIIELQVTVEALLLVLVLIIINNVIRVGNAVGGVVVTRRVERVVQVLHLNDGDVTRRLHDAVVHRTRLLTGGHEVVALEGIVQRGAEGEVAFAMATTGRYRVLGIGVGILRDDTVIVDL